MQDNLVRYSRAGDVFHYRWAARRCLGLIFPNTLLQAVTIEGSKEKGEGEYVIDVAEYYESTDNVRGKTSYFQLKHTSVRANLPFILSDLKDTIEGFAGRYKQILNSDAHASDDEITFNLLTNRPVDEKVKANILGLQNSEEVDQRFKNTLQSYSGLESEQLAAFCRLLNFEDGEGDYNAQKHGLHLEVAQIMAGTVDTPQLDSLVALIQEKALPDSDGQIVQEDVLERFGIYSFRDLYPAPAIWEPMMQIMPRHLHLDLKEKILSAQKPVIIHAAGGVGKSVLSRQLISDLPAGSHGLVYDCFGAGRYRNRSETRHQHRQAFVQITNELATLGLCDPMIPHVNAREEDFMRMFLLRLSAVVEALKRTVDSAKLLVVIDAADNAEMAASEFGQACFAHELLREKLPQDCILVMLCRTERINLLSPPSYVTQLELHPFSEEETGRYLRFQHPSATTDEVQEFHQLTNGNPRVQANAIRDNTFSIVEILHKLGPIGTSVEDQIKLQLAEAINHIKDGLPLDHQHSINAICTGLAALPPLIPIEVLAKVANVSETTIKSFVADIGRPLWLSESFIQFTDEPTETWFRQTYAAKKSDYVNLLAILKPHACDMSYVAEVLPFLFLQAELYNELIDLAHSEAFLPTDNPIDARNIRIYRLQFAFKAALRTKQYKDAIKLAIRAGEEVAGDLRQMQLLKANVDLLGPLLSKEKIKELAFRGLLVSSWNGSGNIFSASLLSSVDVYKPEARAYLRAAARWLRIRMDELDKSENRHFDNDIQDEDILELAFAHLNLNGAQHCVDFLTDLEPATEGFNILHSLSERLVDQGNFTAIQALLECCLRKPLLTIAIASRLLEVGRLPEKHLIEPSLMLLSYHRFNRNRRLTTSQGLIGQAMISFAEICAAHKLSKEKIIRVLRRHFPTKGDESMARDYHSGERDIFLRALSLKNLLCENSIFEIEEILPIKQVSKERQSYYEREISELKEILAASLPWYDLRAKILVNSNNEVLEEMAKAQTKSQSATKNRYKEYDRLPSEIARIINSILILHRNADEIEVENLYQTYFSDKRETFIRDRINLVRAAFRSDHLKILRDRLEASIDLNKIIFSQESPETISERFLLMARAVLVISKDDAGAYFDQSIKIVSKFGDEIAQRWNSVVALAKRATIQKYREDELAFRFIRCAELVGEYVDREKYWDRNEAVRICLRLSPFVAIAAFSRWRDRSVGWFENQLDDFTEELLTSKIVPVEIAWALSCLGGSYPHNDLVELCLRSECSASSKKYILQDIIERLRHNGATSKNWQNLTKVVSEAKLESQQLATINELFQHTPSENNETPRNTELFEIDAGEIKWSEIFDCLDLYSVTGLNTALERFKNASDEYTIPHSFWNHLLRHIQGHSLSSFLDAILILDQLDLYDIRYILNRIPEEWKEKISFKNKWPIYLNKIARKFSTQLSEPYTLRYFIKELGIKDELLSDLHLNILEGLSGGEDFTDANAFFGLVQIATEFVTDDEASQLLQYALSRFEPHIDEDFGDGVWAEWLVPQANINFAVAGFVWSALGAPDARTRWKAVHCVRKLVELNCTDLTTPLMQWMENDEVGPFGSKHFPFYNLHARQYLMIAFSRTSLDNPQWFVNCKDLFLKYVIDQPHALIQRFASEIVFNIEAGIPGSYTTKVLRSVKSACLPKVKKRKASKRNEINSYWHSTGELAEARKFHFAWDFDRYWHEPLGRVFGISGEQIDDLCSDIIRNSWNIQEDGGYNDDPRASLWRNLRDRETWHDHGSYPKIDNLGFYLSYHSLMIVAAKLLQSMPVISKTDDEEEEDAWSLWMERHWLTRSDGKWLSDSRDPVPLERPGWIREKTNKNWLRRLHDNEIVEGFTFWDGQDSWVTIKGHWQEHDSEKSEHYSISSALVSIDTSKSLLFALQTCSDPRDFKLPDYGEEDMEIESNPFRLMGWISDEYSTKGLDQTDPFANAIDYPPIALGNQFANIVGLTAQKDNKIWTTVDQKKALISEIWASLGNGRDETPEQSGNRMQASLEFLKVVCAKTNCSIIFEVAVTRELQLGSEKKDNRKRHNKIFILSADGELRTTDAHFKLRQGVCEKTWA